ncbi:site-2 protease family protein [Nonomuraea gerenzanensis]|uniref:Zinc metalloprotease n=1 Tax=Nonomuraea gerenzanensis TaxID=93944 RepID=A0A1M4EGK6_9ACTN|nr:site-2 protease family protein [Nonomuraea gerenzanensis]UBU09602.1 site-2 protease family protein [Nonomuraea gerenzanensis]SBO98029.1 Zn-dependent proteases [Nonomuraea gerenzanensis]
MSEQSPRQGSSGIRMGKPFGIPVYVSWTWFLVAAFITVMFGPQMRQMLPQLDDFAAYGVAFVFAVLLYVSVLLHELAHSVLAKAYGLPVRRITLYLLGGVSEIEKEPPTPGKEFMVAAAGPALSLGLAGIGLVADVYLINNGGILEVLTWQLWFANLIVGVFNLLPGLPLDGGRMLRAGVWKLTRSPGSGTVVAAWGGRVLAVLLVVFPVASALSAGRELDLTNLVWPLVLASFIWMGASQSLRLAKIRARIPQVNARTLARRAIPVAGETPLSEALRQATERHAGALVVVDHEGRPVAIVSEAAVQATPEHRRPWVNVSSLAKSLEARMILSAALEGEPLIEAMREAPGSEYLLVEDGGEIYGVLSTADVNRVFTGV